VIEISEQDVGKIGKKHAILKGAVGKEMSRC